MGNQMPERRTVLAGVVAGGLALPVLAACGVQNGPPPKAGTKLTKTSDVPVGGGVVLESAKLVVTQPAKGTYKCFSAVCTHQGCLVGAPQNGVITCPCHGSQFSIKNGSNLQGPNGSAAGSVAALAAQSITVKGGEIVLG